VTHIFGLLFDAGKVTTFPEVDEEIDFLSTIISQQETESGFRHPGERTNLWPVPKGATSGGLID
jgi:hypothetical protein